MKRLWKQATQCFHNQFRDNNSDIRQRFWKTDRKMMESTFITIAGISGALGVALGAFGSHSLKRRLPPQDMETFETGVRYQMYHVPGLLGAAFAPLQFPNSGLPAAAGWFFTAGTLLFSGSLYLLVISGRRWLGAVTPFGGLAFIAGWICLLLSGWISG